MKASDFKINEFVTLDKCKSFPDHYNNYIDKCDKFKVRTVNETGIFLRVNENDDMLIYEREIGECNVRKFELPGISKLI